MRKYLLASVAVASLSLVGAGAANATACASASVGSYTTAGFSCSVGNLLFSKFDVQTAVLDNGMITLGNLSPTTFNGDAGIKLNFLASAGPSPPVGGADVTLEYHVTTTNGALISGAGLGIAGTAAGTGIDTLGETLSNNIALQAFVPGNPTSFGSFTPIASLDVLKDGEVLSGPRGQALASAMFNVFSTGGTPVPEPATLGLLAIGVTMLAGVRLARS